MMLRMMQPSQREDSYDSNPKATSKPPRKPSAQLRKPPDVALQELPHIWILQATAKRKQKLFPV